MTTETDIVDILDPHAHLRVALDLAQRARGAIAEGTAEAPGLIRLAEVYTRLAEVCTRGSVAAARDQVLRLRSLNPLPVIDALTDAFRAYTMPITVIEVLHRYRAANAHDRTNNTALRPIAEDIAAVWTKLPAGTTTEAAATAIKGVLTDARVKSPLATRADLAGHVQAALAKAHPHPAAAPLVCNCLGEGV